MRTHRRRNSVQRGLAPLLMALSACAHSAANPYETASVSDRVSFKRVMLPLPPGTHFKISQGAFGRASHSEPGREYSWDFDVPYGTPVLSVEDGQVIAMTAKNGFICTPQLDFGIYQDEKHLYGSGQPRSIPLLFDGLPDSGIAHEGDEEEVTELNGALPLIIREWDEAAYYRHPIQPFPKRIRFETGGHTLTFVATKHKAAIDSRQAIDAALKELTPDVLVIEGIQRSQGVSPRVWDKDLDARINLEGYETYYAYKRALEQKIPFVGSELPGKMSEHTSFERDHSLVRLIWELMARRQNVTVVYGAGHYFQEETALIKLFGKPISVR